MKKIHYKIMQLVIFSLLVLGLIMGTIAIINIKTIGRENIITLDKKLREDFDRLAKSQVESAVKIIENAYQKKETVGLSAAVEDAKDYVRSIKYGESGYIFVYDSKGNTIVLLGGAAEGTNRWELQDSNKNYIVQDIVKAAKDKTGFTTYWYPRPGEEEASPKRAYNQYYEPLDWIIGTGNYIDDIDEIINNETALLNKKLYGIIIMIVLLDILVIIASTVLSWFVGKKISRPVEYLAEEVTKVADGDLSRNIKAHASDETGILAGAINNMITRLRSIVLTISTTADDINKNSIEISTSSQQVASGASEQASSTEEISSSMEELTANIQQNSDNSGKSDKIISQAAIDAQTGGTAVEETATAMKNISDKIRIIEEIARNTNLLALNAAIEAARAGDAGKGFSVVAAEVRKLAENSQNAANEITGIAAESVKKADETMELMRNMVPAIQDSAEIAKEIMMGSSEQAKGAEQINSALMQMDNVIQTNASASEEIAAMADELKSKSMDLNHAVSFFHISGKKKEIKPEDKKPLIRKTVQGLPAEKLNNSTKDRKIYHSSDSYSDFSDKGFTEF